MKEITYDELREWPEGSYQLIDIRDEGLTAYGIIPGAVSIYVEELEHSSELSSIPKDKKLVFYCQIGRMSREIDDTQECFEGRDCYSLAEGIGQGAERKRRETEGRIGVLKAQIDAELKKAALRLWRISSCRSWNGEAERSNVTKL